MPVPRLARTKPSPAYALGVIVGAILLIVVNVALGGLTAFVWLNWIGGFGLSFAQIVGLGGLLAVIEPTIEYNAS